MKKIYAIFSFIMMCFLLSSCTTYQKITINGTPGTEIYTPNMQRLGVIENGGNTIIKISRNSYYPYLLSHQDNSSTLVPFALDYKRKSYTGNKITNVTSITLAYAAYISSLVCADQTALFAGCLGVAAAGTAIGITSIKRSMQLQYRYKFEYLPSQSTIQDIRFTPITDTGYKKQLLSPVTDLTSHKVETVQNATPSSIARKKSSASSRTFNDYGRIIAGKYTGNGLLIKNDNIIEKYDKVNIIIKRIDKNTVSVDVIESNESFFNSKYEYKIEKTGGKYILSLKGIPSASISIDAKGRLSYRHPKVNIDGEIYTLELTATKQ